MDLDKRREELLKQKEDQEQIKKAAHEEILKIKAKLRKLAFVARDAEELFDDDWASMKSGVNAIETHEE